jgi:hypothetical protein
MTGSSLLEVMTTKEISYGIDPHRPRSGVVVWRRRILGASARSLVGGGHRAKWAMSAKFRFAMLTAGQQQRERH